MKGIISDDPLDRLANCTLEEVCLLDSICPDDLIEWIVDDDASLALDDTSLNVDDLCDWLEDDEDFNSVGQGPLNNTLEPLQLKRSPIKKGTYTNKSVARSPNPCLNKVTLQHDGTEKDGKAKSIYLESFLSTMQKTHKSRQQILGRNNDALAYTSSFSKLNDLMNGKRGSLTSELEESRKKLKMMKGNMIGDYATPLKHNDFFIGKRGSLTAELEESRKRLMQLGGPRPRTLKRASYVSNIQNALMA